MHMKKKLRLFLSLGWILSLSMVSQAAQPALELVSEGYVSPLNLLSVPGKKRDLIVADQVGKIYYLPQGKDAKKTVFLDLTSKMAKLRQGFDERGLLGVAFHPEYPKNRSVYVYYSAPLQDGGPDGWDHTSHISQFTVPKKNGRKADPSSEKVILKVDQPQFNHNSGRIAFGPDGYLYISLGDGGGGNDVGPGHGDNGNGQNTQTLLGTVLRIDVNNGAPYSIPKDNPFVNGGGRPEIFAYGLRNPWGMGFDQGGDRNLFLADVGQSRWEEVNIIENGGNYGWRVREGLTGFDPKKARTTDNLEAPKKDKSGNTFKEPIIVYKNKGAFNKDKEAIGISITGGFVYRGKALPQLNGAYIFGDWSLGWGASKGIIFVSKIVDGKWDLNLLKSPHIPDGQVKGYVVAFGQDATGEMYVMTNDSNALVNKTGKVYKLVAKD